MIDITIVMAIYKPNKKWLIEELESIYSQTYRNFQVLVWNDYPDDDFDYQELFAKYLREIPFKFYQGKENLGSNGAFENLTKLTITKYIAYCDQDDIWLPDKLTILHQLLSENQENTLAFSDMMVINENSEIVAKNIRKVRPRQVFYPGKDALIHLLAKNFVTGCTMMMRTDVAKDSIPFPKEVFHDWWLAICSATKGNLVMAKKPLMKYRIYDNNQSGVLKGIIDKKTYYQKRILSQKKLIGYAVSKFKFNQYIIQANFWMNARERYFFHPTFMDFKYLFLLWKYNKLTVMFEALLPIMPNAIFDFFIKNVKEGRL